MLTSDCGHFAVQSAWFESTKVSLARLCRLKTPRPWQPLCFVLVSYLQFPSQMRRPWRPASHTPRHCSHNTQISDLPAKFDEWLVAKAKTKKLSDVNIFQSLHSIIVYYVYTVLLLLYIYIIYTVDIVCIYPLCSQVPAFQLLQTKVQLSKTPATKGREQNQSQIAAGICAPALPQQDVPVNRYCGCWELSRIVAGIVLACLSNLSGHAWRPRCSEV